MLKVKDLGVARGGVPVLEGVTFEVAAGEALVLRGANGIGKTSLLRCLAGLQPATHGKIDVVSEDVAYASHDDGVKAQLSVAENLAFWAEIYGRSVPETVFETFELADLRDRLAGTLSAGQRRRVGLARLGVIGRSVLVLDEPTVSLDGFAVKMFASWLTDTHLAGGGCAVIATHIDLGIDAPALELETYRATTLPSEDEAFL